MHVHVYMYILCSSQTNTGYMYVPAHVHYKTVINACKVYLPENCRCTCTIKLRYCSPTWHSGAFLNPQLTASHWCRWLGAMRTQTISSNESWLSRCAYGVHCPYCPASPPENAPPSKISISNTKSNTRFKI